MGGLCICLSKKTAVAEEFWDSWKVSRSLGGKSVNVSHDNVIKSFYPCKNFIKVRERESNGRGKRWDEGGVGTVIVSLMRDRISAVERSSSTLLGPWTLICMLNINDEVYVDICSTASL